jgi:hypothetical protein
MKLKIKLGLIGIFVTLISIFNSCSKLVDKKVSIGNIQTTTHDFKNYSTSVTLSQAKELAQGFLQSKNHTVQFDIKSAVTILNEGKAYFHIINANKGFVIISSDSLYPPILAFDTISNFSFEEKDMNAGLVLWLNKHSFQLDFVRNSKTPYVDSIGKNNKMLWNSMASIAASKNAIVSFGSASNSIPPIKRTTYLKPKSHSITLGVRELDPTVVTTYNTYNTQIGPLLGSLNWSQVAPFNNECPKVFTGDVYPYQSNGRVLPGGLPVAMAQVMYYWSWPSSYNFGGMTYKPQWSNMALYDDPSDPIQNYSINPQKFTDASILISKIGYTAVVDKVIPFADWKTDGYGTYSNPKDAPEVFRRFGYDNVALDGYSEFSSRWWFGPPNDGFTQAMINSVLDKKPCIVAGKTHYIVGDIFSFYSDGYFHAWVCDGLQQFYTQEKTTYTYFMRQRGGGFLEEEVVSVSNPYLIGNFLHFNWGLGVASANQGPRNNGFYDINTNYTLAPNGNEYKYFQMVIYNIKH